MTVSDHDRERLEALESQLRASEELKGRLIACSRDCIKVLDLEGRLLFMNEGGMQVLEICDLAPFVNGSWLEFWEGEDREAARAALQLARDGGTGRFVGYFETRISRQPRWWDVAVSPILDASGKPERLLALSRDVTEHRKNEIALREAIQFNREIIEDAAEGIIVYDSELRYRLFNPVMERPTGKRSEEVLGRVATEVFPRLGPSGIEAALKRALQGECVYVEDVLIPKHSADGQSQEHEAYGVGAAAMIPWASFFHNLNDGMSVGDMAAKYGVSTALITYRISITGATNLHRSRQKTRRPRRTG